MVKKPETNQAELDAFYEAMKGTQPLSKQKSRQPLSPPTPPVKKRIRKKEVMEDIFHLNEANDIQTLDKEEQISFKQPSLPNKILRNLRKGQYNIDAILDLHGMTIDEARSNVDQFIQHCLSQHARVALIIHGKGHHSQMPILKNKLNQWLRQIDVILAFCSAAPRHGSRGAVYILLKRLEEGSA